MVRPVDASTRASSSMVMMKLRRSSPAPPSDSDHGTPSSPSSPIFLTVSQGNEPSASWRAATGATSSCAKCRTISRTARCCSEKYSWSSMSSGRFRFVGGSHELEESLAVLVDLHRTYPADLAERVRRLRATDGDLEQRPVGEHDVRGHLLLARD